MLILNRNTFTSAAILALSVALTGCGKDYGSLTLSAVDSASSPSLLSALNPFASSALAFPTVNEFTVCIKKIKLEDETGEAQSGDDSEESEIEFKPGLIDLASLSTEKTLGSLANAPVGFKISKVKIKVRQDKSLCGESSHAITWKQDGGTTYSTDDEIEFKWVFNPAVDLAGGDTVQLTFNEFKTALTNLNSGNGFSTAITGATGTARIKSR